MKLIAINQLFVMIAKENLLYFMKFFVLFCCVKVVEKNFPFEGNCASICEKAKI